MWALEKVYLNADFSNVGSRYGSCLCLKKLIVLSHEQFSDATFFVLQTSGSKLATQGPDTEVSNVFRQRKISIFL